MKKTAVLICFLAALLLFVFPAFAAEPNAVDILNDPNGRLLGVCPGGLRHEYPENSLEGIEAAGKTGIDFVLTDVRKTADGSFVLLKDDTTKRMLTGEEKNISDLTAGELSQRFLKEGFGGAGAKDSVYHPAFLSDALTSAKENGHSLMIACRAEDIPEVSEAVANAGMTDLVALFVNAPADELAAAAEKTENLPAVLGQKRGNVIFAVNSYIRAMAENGFAGTALKTTNRYGVIFHQTVLKYFSGKLRAVADFTDPALFGAREDSEKWWNDAFSRGYSVAFTDFPELFVEYLQRNDAAKEDLKAVYDKYTKDWTLPAFASDLFNDYKKAYTDAVAKADALFADGSNSLQDINDCISALQKAVDDIDLNYEALENGSAGMTVSAPRIGLCIGAAAVVIAVQIFFWKKRKEEN